MAHAVVTPGGFSLSASLGMNAAAVQDLATPRAFDVIGNERDPEPEQQRVDIRVGT